LGKNNNNLSKAEISIVIPVYNEAEHISSTLDKITAMLDVTQLEYEILVVNDGSTDGTCHILEKESQLDRRIKVISYDVNMGKGYAVKQGVLKCEGKIIMFLDGDLDISPAGIQEYVKELESCDIVIASKMHPLSKVKCPPSRRFLSRGFNLIVRALTGVKVTDTQSGLKAAKSGSLKVIFNMMKTNRFAFDVELITAAHANNLSLKELPIELEILVPFKYREIAIMFWDLLVIGYRHRIRHEYTRGVMETSRQDYGLEDVPLIK
jgi:glycosyltransferase involved in cell wall biosynthesis